MGRSKVLFAALFLFLTVTAVNAYTIVLRDGRRVEIPNHFAVTNSTLTYAMGNGIQVTIQLNTVDIGATERANGETPGALLMKANESKPEVAPAPQTLRANAERSITNQDLEKYRRARVESEKEREELGLPSLEDRRRETAMIEDRAVEQARNMRAQEEAYWRGRAEALRAENEAQFRQGPQNLPWSYSSGALLPFDGVGFGVTAGPFGRFRRFSPSPFDGFLATPITPFPGFPFDGRRRVFVAPGVRISPRPNHTRHR
jgi:hypothetical protein